MSKNIVILEGVIGNNPEIRTTSNGTPVINLRMATSYYFKVKDERHETTSWHSLVFYGRLAENAEHLKKGDSVYVEGRLEYREYTPADGSKRNVTEVIVNEFHKIDRELWKTAAEARRRGEKPEINAASENRAGDDVEGFKGLT